MAASKDDVIRQVKFTVPADVTFRDTAPTWEERVENHLVEVTLDFTDNEGYTVTEASKVTVELARQR